MLLIILSAIIFVIVVFNIFVYLLGKKIQKLEQDIMTIFQKRSSEVIGVYQVSKDELVRANEIFKDFFELRRREFWEDSTIYVDLESKLIMYSKIHNEINFIFKTCEQHKKIQDNATYQYFKESIQEKSTEIGEKMNVYNKIKEKYDHYKDISKLMIIGYLY